LKQAHWALLVIFIEHRNTIKLKDVDLTILRDE
jgi:hypothetical protein